MADTSVCISPDTSSSSEILTECEKSLQEHLKRKVKRSRNPDNWKKEKRKRAILSGQAYLNTKGELVGPKVIGPDCNCKHRCFDSVSTENRLNIFNGYYSLKSYDEQNAYLYGLIRRYDIQRKKKPISQKRTCSYKYYIRIKGKEIQVCKKAFAHIHGITDKKIRTLCIKHEQNVLFPRDNRGRHNNRPKKVTPELITLIKQHILTSLSGLNVNDYIKTDKNQLPDVNISKLHKNFLRQYQPDAVDEECEKVKTSSNVSVKSWLYFKVFHEEFNSSDFHTVKRRLVDLRKSLEVKSGTKSKKKVLKQNTKKKNTLLLVPSEVDQQNSPLRTNQSNSFSSCLSSEQGTNQDFSSGLQQQKTNSHSLQFGMFGLQASNKHDVSPSNMSASAVQHFPNQHGGVPISNESFSVNEQFPYNQPLPLNFQSVNSSSLSSYYLCLGRVSNIIPLSVSCPPNQSTHFIQNQSQGQIISTSTNSTMQTSHPSCNIENVSTFTSLHSQFPSTSSFLQSSSRTQNPNLSIQSPVMSSRSLNSIDESYTSLQPHQSSNLNLMY